VEAVQELGFTEMAIVVGGFQWNAMKRTWNVSRYELYEII